MAEGKTSARVAMALMCGLAICCAVMYVTADGADVQETVLAPAKSVYGIGGPTSVDSTDVEKAGSVFTNTPDGRMRLTDYLSNVEKEIAAEEAARKRDVAAVQAQMARNFAFNAEARKKLKAAMLHKMAINAKKAKDDLAKAMVFVQKKFADMASLQNKRNNANIKRSAEIRKVVAANKAESEKNLATAVMTQQRAMSTLESATNARIAKTNKHVAANAAQIKSNAKKAADELAKAVDIFNKKAESARGEAANGRNKLEEQLQAQDKSIRQWAKNKMAITVAKTAAQFRRVREQMADDRHKADLALKAASSRMTASMNAFSALNDKRFEKTVKDIATAKSEASARVKAAQTAFKAQLFTLSATVEEQRKKTDARIDQLTNTVTANKVAQAKANGNVDAEIKRMVALGNKRYNEHLKKDKELESLIKSNKAATDARMDAMADHYMMEISAVRATMKKNRAHATHMLAKESSKLYAAIEKSEREQMATNKNLAEQTRRARLDIEDSLRAAKTDFADRIGKLHKTVVHNDKKFEKKIDKLTGIVREDAVKSAKGRAELKSVMDANKQSLKTAVRDAISKGEKRMSAAETKLTDLNKKTKAALNLKITTEISTLTKRANSQIEGLRLSSKEARDEMKKELLFAVRSAADDAKKNLDDAQKTMQAKFMAVGKAEAAAAKESAAGRAALAKKIALEKKIAKQQLDDGVATMHRSLLALKTETQAKIKKTNDKVDAYAAALTKEAADVAALMKANLATMQSKIEAQKKAALADLKAADAASAKGFSEASDAVSAALDAAEKKSEKKFGKLFVDMGKQRSDLDKDLAGAITEINDSIAKQAALSDSRFSKTVKDIKAAREEAAHQVKTARKDFATSLAATEATVRDMDTKLTAQVELVSAEVISHKAVQARVNRHVKGELGRIQKLMNHRFSVSVKARGQLRMILNENKRAAAEEVKALNGLFSSKIGKIRKQAKDDSTSAAKDLTKATESMYDKMAAIQREQLYENKEAVNKINTYSAKQLADVKAAKEDFNSRLTTLTNTIGANHKKVEKGFEVLTGVIRDYNKAGEADRALIRKQNDAMAADMQAKITTAIQIGEAKAKAVEERARVALAGMKKTMLIEITNTVENVADKTFKTIQGSHAKIADNYLSLKAYAITAADALSKYIIAGKGKNLSSLGDLLANVGALSEVKPQKAEGIAPSGTLPEIFSGDTVKIDNSVRKINGLVNEYVAVANSCRERWPMGLGKYLLLKLEQSMQKKGVLQVDKLDSKSGNFVFMNGHAVGLSNKLNDFEALAVRMPHYEATLAKLTAELSGKVEKAKKKVYVKPPEWDGN
jgi:hypothetical protein